MTDKEFLIWIHQRLRYVHKESPYVDYMWKLRSIIQETDPTKTTPNTVSTLNEMEKWK
jgi:hypothetical protein